MSAEPIVYALHHAESDHVYIGQSRNGISRPKGHGSPSRLTRTIPIAFWIKSLQKRGLKYEITVLEQCTTAGELDEAECFYIAYFRSLGIPLLNCTDGGDGARNPSPETRRKQSLAKKGVPLRQAHRNSIADALRGRVFSDAWRQKISAAKTGNSPSRHIVELNISRIGQPLTAEHCLKMSQVRKGKKYTTAAQMRQKDLISARVRGENNSFSKLSATQVKQIREMLDLGFGRFAIARVFKVSRSTIGRIQLGQNWKH